MEENVALFDMDSSLADFNKAMLRDLNLLRSPEEPEVTEDNIWQSKDVPHLSARMKLIKVVPGWWANLEPIEIGFWVFGLCKMFQFDNVIFTKGPKKNSLAWKEKVDWAEKHVPDAGLHIVTGKGLTYGKLLYDDWPEYMLAWLKWRPRGLGIMPKTAYNKGFSHPNVIMYDGENLTQIAKAIKLCKDRKEGEVIEWNQLK